MSNSWESIFGATDKVDDLIEKFEDENASAVTYKEVGDAVFDLGSKIEDMTNRSQRYGISEAAKARLLSNIKYASGRLDLLHSFSEAKQAADPLWAESDESDEYDEYDD